MTLSSEVAEAGSMRNSWAAQRAYYHPTADCCITLTRWAALYARSSRPLRRAGCL
jgi:hypothetical protein